MQKHLFKLSFYGFFCTSSALFGAFCGCSDDFHSPIKLAYDFTEIPELEALVIAENEKNALNEIAAADISLKKETSQ